MSVFRQFLVVIAAVVVALTLVAGVLASIAVISPDHGTAFLNPQLIFNATIFFGAPLVLLLGAPAYFVLLRKGQARWYYVLTLGVIPGLVLLLMDTMLGVFAVVCGGIVSLVTHLACRRFVRAPVPT